MMRRWRRDAEELPPEVVSGDVVGVDDPLVDGYDDRQPITPRTVLWGIAGVGALIIVLSVGSALWRNATDGYRVQRLEDLAFYEDAAATLRSHIISCQVEGGALLQEPVSDGEGSVVPYFANLAVLGLLQGTPSEGDLACAQRYLGWYASQIEAGAAIGLPKGVLADYTVTVRGGKVVRTQLTEPDSWDSYAATYLMALAAFHEAGGSENFVNARYDEAEDALSVILDLQGEDGLTRVSGSNNTRYLMDNLEVLAGLYDAMELYDEVWIPDAADDTSLAPLLGEERADLGQAADDCLQGILEFLWDEPEETWRIGLDAVGDPIPFEGWEQFYPSAVAQLYPIMFAQATDAEIAGVPDARADATLRGSQHLYDRFCASYPSWQQLTDLEGEDGLHWSSIAWVAARMDDEGRASVYLENFEAATDRDGDSPRLYVADAGWAARTAVYLADQARKEVGDGIG